MSQRDIVAVVEAAYAIERDEFAWLRGILDVAGPLLDVGLGTFANSFDLTPRMRIVTRATALSGIPDTLAPLAAQAGHEVPPDLVARFVSSVVSTMSDLWGGPAEAFEHQRYAGPALGATDFLGIVARNPTGRVVVLGAALPQVTPTDPELASRWSLVAAHVAAAARLRERLGEPRAASVPELAAATAAVDRARGELRKEDALAALRAWRPLFAERFTLLDHRDDGGVVRLRAYENAPDTPSYVELDARESRIAAFAALGHSHALVAYELGISEKDVGDALASAIAKLGVRSHAELLEKLAVA